MLYEIGFKGGDRISVSIDDLAAFIDGIKDAIGTDPSAENRVIFDKEGIMFTATDIEFIKRLAVLPNESLVVF